MALRAFIPARRPVGDWRKAWQSGGSRDRLGLLIASDHLNLHLKAGFTNTTPCRPSSQRCSSAIPAAPRR